MAQIIDIINSTREVDFQFGLAEPYFTYLFTESAL